MIVTVYLILLPTGLVDDDGVESVVVLGVKLTRAAAEAVQKEHNGAFIDKRRAEK